MEKRIKKGWMPLRITKIIDDTWDTKTFYFVNHEEDSRAFDYEPGQYITFRYDSISEKPLVRSYSMSSAPCELEAIGVTVKRVDNGVVSNWMCDVLRVGDILRARGAMGKFIYDPVADQKHLVMIGAGSGVTPFRSIMKEFFAGGIPTLETATLLVSYKSTSDILFREELEQFSQSTRCRIFITLSRENSTRYFHGRIGPEFFDQTLNSHMNAATYMICGPDEMMESAKNELLKRAVLEDQIKLESFAG